MRKVTIWKLTYQSDPEPGSCLVFCGSRKDAINEFDRLKAIHRENGDSAHRETIIPLDITLSKEGVLQLLKYHCPSTENG